MRRVLLVGGCRDGDRVQVSDEYCEYIRMPAKVQLETLLSNPNPLATVDVTTYKLERFQCGNTTVWVAYPVGISPEHGLSMLLAGYVGNS